MNLIDGCELSNGRAGPVGLFFCVVNTGGVTTYRVNEGVANSTGIDWSGYHRRHSPVAPQRVLA